MYTEDILTIPWREDSKYIPLIEGLVEKGWHKQDAFLPLRLVAALKAEMDGLGNTQLMPAGVGKGRQHRYAERIRQDKTYWLEGDTSAQKAFFYIAEQLRCYLNRELFLGLFDFEAHYSLYAPGAYYKKHLDVFRNDDLRHISTVYYLNEDWQADKGGELILYCPEEDRVLERIIPQAGTIVLFISNRFPHEVLPAVAPRYSIAGWYRVNNTTR